MAALTEVTLRSSSTSLRTLGSVSNSKIYVSALTAQNESTRLLMTHRYYPKIIA